MNANEQWQMSRDAAQGYERYVARYILGPWAPVLVEAAGVASGERVLDLACGTGVVARVAAARAGPGGRVVGIDLNPGMIAVARASPAPAGAPIEWIEGSALDLALPDASVDGVLCQQGLQFFPDRPRSMREMRRVLRSGGRIALAVWSNTGLYNTAVGDALESVVSAEVAARFCASRRAPGREELEALAAEAGFSSVEIRVGRIDVRLPELDAFALDHLSATPVAPAIAALDPDERSRIGRRVTAALAGYRQGDGVVYPEETYLLTARSS